MWDTNDGNRIDKKLTFKNNGGFISRISKINKLFIDNAEDLGFVMPIYNLLEFRNSYSMTSEILWNYYRDEVNDCANETDDSDNEINNNKTTTDKLFEYEIKMIGSTPNNINILEEEVVVPLNYLIYFWRSLNLSLINCEIELHLRWIGNCLIFEMPRKFRVVGDTPEQELETATTRTTFQINNVELYVPVVTFSINDKINFLENIKQGFKRTIYWNKQRSEITT